MMKIHCYIKESLNCVKIKLIFHDFRGLPCGIEPPEPVIGPDGDKLATIASRFSYFQEKRHSTLTKTDLRRHANSPTKSKNARPTVRLRPRQVRKKSLSTLSRKSKLKSKTFLIIPGPVQQMQFDL